MDPKRINEVCKELKATGTGEAKLPAIANVLSKHSDKDKAGLTKQFERAGIGSGTIDKIFQRLG